MNLVDLYKAWRMRTAPHRRVCCAGCRLWDAPAAFCWHPTHTRDTCTLCCPWTGQHPAGDDEFDGLDGVAA